MTLLNQVKTLFQRETVFCVSLVLAVLSALAVRPDAAYQIGRASCRERV